MPQPAQQVQREPQLVSEPQQGPKLPPQRKALPAGLRPQMMPTAVRVQRPAVARPRPVPVASAPFEPEAALPQPEGKAPAVTAAQPEQPAPPAEAASGGAAPDSSSYDEFAAAMKQLGALP